MPGRADSVRLLSVSFDPEHDTPEVLRALCGLELLHVFALIHDDIPRITNVGVRLDAEGEPLPWRYDGDDTSVTADEVDAALRRLLDAVYQEPDVLGDVLRLAVAKSHAVPAPDDALVITADTTVDLTNRAALIGHSTGDQIGRAHV